MDSKQQTLDFDNELRIQRLRVYEDLWRRLELLARYDRPEPLNAATLKMLSTSMRDWYFEIGGIYLSEESRPAYFNLKEGIDKIVQANQDQAERALSDEESAFILKLASQLRARLANDVGTRRSTFANVAVADPSNIQQVAASQLELINSYYTSILKQANQSFFWALLAAGIGLLFFIAAVGFLLLRQSSGLSTVSVVSGGLIEVISGVNFFLYGKALNQLELFHVRLERTQRYLLANSVCENLKGAAQQTARAELVRTIAGAQPDAAHPPSQPGAETNVD